MPSTLRTQLNQALKERNDALDLAATYAAEVFSLTESNRRLTDCIANALMGAVTFNDIQKEIERT
jgi:hypothetical protein